MQNEQTKNSSKYTISMSNTIYLTKWSSLFSAVRIAYDDVDYYIKPHFYYKCEKKP